MKDLECKLAILKDGAYEYSDSYKRRAEGNIEIDPNDLSIKTIDWFQNWVAEYDQLCKGPELQLLGRYLYAVLFTGELKEAFEATFEAFEDEHRADQEARLRLVLIFNRQAGAIADYPWEFLYIPRDPDGFFMAGEKTELVLTRFVPEARVAPVTHDLPLRILTAFSHPASLPSIDAEQATEVIEEIKALKNLGDIEVEELDNPTFEQLKGAVERKDARPHILHFIGHGDSGKIALKRPDAEVVRDRQANEALRAAGRPEKPVDEHVWIDSGTVGNLFDNHQPRLVFLHACKGASGAIKSMYSTALELVYSKIPAVVAMQYEISNDAAKIFAITFYKEIGKGKPIDEAVVLARNALGVSPANLGRGAWNDRNFGSPVVYLQNKEPIVFTIRPGQPGGKPNGQGSDLPNEKARCPYSDCMLGRVVSGQRFCSSCKRELLVCPKCAYPVAKVDGFCTNCGWESDAPGAAAATHQAAAPPSTQSGMGPSGAGGRSGG